MKILKYILLISLTLIFVSCSISTVFQYTKQSNTMYLGNTKIPVKVVFTQANYRGNINICTKFPYTINDKHEKYGLLFVESISLHEICNWNGFPLSLLEEKIRFSGGIDSMKSVEKIVTNNYVFKHI